MDFKLNKLDGENVFYLAAKDARCLGDTLIEGTFTEVLTYANQLKNVPETFLGGDAYHQVGNAEVTDVIEEKWFCIDLNNLYLMTDIDTIKANGVLQIIKTDGNTAYSLPTNRYTTTGTLEEIFTRVSIYITELLK